MPGFAVHYLFGEETLRDYRDDFVKKSIKRHRELYNIGIQGPDLFFYYFLSPFQYKRNIGSIMHTKDIGEFKKNFLYIIKKTKNEDMKMLGVAYFAGFLGHCTLDKICHPYIYAVTDYEHKTKSYFSKQVDLETEIDSIYIKRYMNIDLYDFRRKEVIRINNMELKGLARMFVAAFKKTYPDVNLSERRMRLVINIFNQSCYIFNDRFGIKKKIVGMIEKKILKKKVISPMFIEKKRKKTNKDVLNKEAASWYNPWAKENISKKNFDELFDTALDEYKTVLYELNEFVENENIENLNKTIENISLHSGLDCSIPS